MQHYGILAHATHLSGDRGENFRLYGGGGVPRMALLHTFSPGKLLFATTRCPAQRRACGELLARLGHALRTFDHAGSRHESAWDITQVPRLAEVIPRVPDLGSVDFLRAFVDLFTARVVPRLRRMRCQFVHGDFTARNIVVESRKTSNVVGIIGFGSAVHTALVADVAAGACGQLTVPEKAHEAVHEFVEAYLQGRALVERGVGPAQLADRRADCAGDGTGRVAAGVPAPRGTISR